MSYTTRCPACGTTFRVVPDQLKISDGWVRCGHCSDVFDATLHLETWSPPPVAPGPAQVAARQEQPPTTARSGGATDDPKSDGWAAAPFRAEETSVEVDAVLSPEAVPAPQVPEDDLVESTDETPLATGAAADAPDAGSAPPAHTSGSVVESDFLAELQRFAAKSGSEPAAEAPAVERVPAAPTVRPKRASASGSAARSPVAMRDAPSASASTPIASPVSGVDVEIDVELPPVATAALADPPRKSEREAGPVAAEVAAPVPPAEPGFVQQARRRAYWESPSMRAVLAVGVFVLSGALLLQWMVFERDRLAAWRPGLKPVVQTLCGVFGCTVEPVRRIDAIVIDSTALVRRLGNFYSFDFVLKNTASIDVAVPALELSLTDAGDNVISRRVFLAQDMPEAPEVLAAGRSLGVNLKLSIAVGDTVPMAGYRALAFYP